MVEENNQTEIFTPALSDQIIEEYGEIFQPATLDNQEVYLEQHESEDIFPLTRVFIFGEDVLEVYGRGMREVFGIDADDAEVLREIREEGKKIKEQSVEEDGYKMLREVDVQGKINAIKYYSQDNLEEIHRLKSELRKKKRLNYIDI